MEREIKSCRAYGVKAVDSEAGIIEAIVAVFGNVDMGADRILPGAFAASLSARLPKGCWMHDWTQPVAKTLVAEELLPGDARLPGDIRDLGGLYIKGQFNLGTQRGREAFSDLSFGTVDEFSIGYWATKWQYDEETDVRDLVEIELYEWSPVLVGMNPATALLSAKGGPVSGLSPEAHADAVVSAAAAFLERATASAGARAADGRKLSPAYAERCGKVRDALAKVADGLGGLAAATDNAGTAGSGADMAYARFVALCNGVEV